MFLISAFLLYLAIVRRFEPLLLLPIGVAIMLTNLFPALVATVEPGSGEHAGLFWVFQEFGLRSEIFPLLMFLGLGALSDFTPMMQRPILVIMGAAAQVGIFATLIGALFLVDFLVDVDSGISPLRIAAAISIIGSADGPTTIYTSSKFLSGTSYDGLLGAIAISAYTYMALVPLIQPPIMKLMTTKRERSVVMPYDDKPVSKQARILFPIAVIIITAIIAPDAGPLVGLLMLGNLLRESGVVERLFQSAQNELTNLVTILLGLSVGSTMVADAFLQPLTLAVFALGLGAFAIATMSGVALGKVLYIVSKRRINPLLGAAGVSAVPMAARVVNQVALEENPETFLLMHALAPNVAGVLGSAIAAGVIISLVPH